MSHAKSPTLKAISGTARPDREEPADVPQYDPVREFPAPPQHLTVDGVEMWKDLGPKLTAAGVLQVVDLYPLEQLCVAWQGFRKKAKADMEITASEHNALQSIFGTFGIGPTARRRVVANLSAPNAPANQPPFLFDASEAWNACDFIEKLPHVEGTWETPTIVLHPSHVFFLVQLFGFRNLEGGRGSRRRCSLWRARTRRARSPRRSCFIACAAKWNLAPQ
jgi:hypothetical protein